jgi:hypothetical protein
MTDKSKRKGGPWQPGQSGNPNGRPRNARNMVTRAVEALLEGEHEALTRKAIEKAKEGDNIALRLCLERIAPVRKDAPITFELPAIETASDTMAASASVLAAVAAGDVTPGEAGVVMALLTAHKAIVETCDLEARLTALEERNEKK